MFFKFVGKICILGLILKKKGLLKYCNCKFEFCYDRYDIGRVKSKVNIVFKIYLFCI